MSSVPLFISKRSTPTSFQVYNASNNELVRTNTLVKGAIIQVDATPFRQWYEAHVRFFPEGHPQRGNEILIMTNSTPNR